MIKRIHGSMAPLQLPLNQREHTHWLKPSGLWYGIGNAWLEFSKHNLEESYKYVYDIKLAKNIKLLTLATKQEVIDFSNLYKDKSKIKINWAKVIKKWDGLEFNPYYGHSLDFNSAFIWYYAIDVPSGVIWNPSSIVNIIPILL